MANKGRTYAENLVGPLDRSYYGQQRDVAQNTYNTNWQNVQNQYNNLQEKLKLQQQRANRDFAEGLVDVAENSFNRQRLGSANLSNRGLAASGLTNLLNQADTAQKGEDIGKLLKSAGAISTETADKLSQANTKYAQESSDLLGKLANTLGDIGDAETAAQNRYNQVLAGIAGAMDEREANNALQAAQRAASASSSGRSKELSDLQSALDEFNRKSVISEILASPDMTDLQKENYLKIMFGMDNASDAVSAYNKNINATTDYNTQLAKLQKAADREMAQNKRSQLPTVVNTNLRKDNTINPIYYNVGQTSTSPTSSKNYSSIKDLQALRNFERQGITYEDLAALLYGNR